MSHKRIYVRMLLSGRKRRRKLPACADRSIKEKCHNEGHFLIDSFPPNSQLPSSQSSQAPKAPKLPKLPKLPSSQAPKHPPAKGSPKEAGKLPSRSITKSQPQNLPALG